MGKKIADNLRLIIEIVLAVIIVGGVTYNHGKLTQTVEDEKIQRCILAEKMEKTIDAQHDLRIAVVKLTKEIERFNDKIKK